MGPNATALGAFIAGSRDRKLPPEIANAAKLCLADWMSVALGAAAEPAGRIAREVAAGWRSEGRAALLLGGRAAPPVAALANGTLAHCLDFDDTYVDSIQRYWKAFNRMHYGPIPSTIRIHDLDWRGWSDAPRILAGFGMRMNSDYYHYGPLFHIGLDEWAFGHFSGSGLPMRFANEDGRILDIYQQVTQFGDEHFFEVPWTSPENMGPKRGAETTAALFQSSLEGNFAAIAINFHSDPYDMEDRYRLPATEFLAGTLDAAHEKGLPIWNTERWLNFTSARQSARFEALNWADQTLAFDLTVPEQPQDGLSVLIPLDNNQAALSWVRVDGEESEFVNWRVGGVKYGLVSLAPGSHHVAAGYA